MENIIFIGLQGAGKSTFYQQRFSTSHLRINLDMLKNRYRESLFLHACFAVQQRFVVDNTNVTIATRANYIKLAKAAEFKTIGYYFIPVVEDCIARNEQREGKQRLSIKAIKGIFNKLQAPTYEEGFDELFSVEIAPQRSFTVTLIER